MDERDEELLARLLPTFREEAAEHLQRVDTLLASLAREHSVAALEEAFRAVHSLKGAARAVNAQEVETLCQEMEGVFAALKKGELGLAPPLLDLLYRAGDLAADLSREAGRPVSAEMTVLLQETTRRLAGALRHPPAVSAPPAPEPPPRKKEEPPLPRAELETLRVGAETVASVLVQAEELLTDKLAARRQVDGVRGGIAELESLRRTLALASAEARALQRRRSSRGDKRAEGRVLRLNALVAGSDEGAAAAERTLRQLLREGEEHERALGSKIDTLLDTVRQTLMLPVAPLLEQLPRVARDLAREGGKVADMETAGGEIRMDRRILEALRDPLLHLVRNAIDHGLEPPAERRERGKPERGTIRLEASAPSPRRVLFTLSDDGRGIDFEGLREAAVRLGTLTPEEGEAIDEERLSALAFSSGVSTREEVTTVSGRGIGLSIVREKVEGVGGSVSVSSRRGEGAIFRLEIPAALAAFRGVLVRLGGERFVFPACNVERVLRIDAGRVAVVEGRRVLELDGEILPLADLEEPLELPLPREAQRGILSLVVAVSRQKRIAFIVDEVVSEQEFLVKNLGRQLLQVRNISGAAILGDGGIALILDPDDLLQAPARRGRPLSPPPSEPPEAHRRKVLIVEDSITARTLLRNILEGAGYAVTTATDGIEALEKLVASPFDVVVSDVEMPRMDGFELTRRVRETYGRLPVVLVTGLADPEDRRRGIDVGADAYIVKSRFDQGNLLEVLGRLT